MIIMEPDNNNVTKTLNIGSGLEKICIDDHNKISYVKDDVEHAADTVRELMKSIVKDLDGRTFLYNIYSDEVTKVKSAFQSKAKQIEKRITERSTTLQTLIKKFEAEALQEVQAAENTALEEYDALSKTYTILNESVEDARTDINESLEFSAEDMISFYDDQHETFQEQFKMNIPEIPYYEIQLNMSSEIDERISKELLCDFRVQKMQQRVEYRKLHEFDVPYKVEGISVTEEDNLVVCEHRGSKVAIYNPDGNLHAKLDMPSRTWTWGVHSVGDDIYISDINTKSILVFNKAGSLKSILPAQFEGAAGITKHEDTLLITSSDDNCVYEMKLTDEQSPASQDKLCLFGQLSSFDLVDPRYIACNKDIVAVSSPASGVIHVLNTEGSHLYSYSSKSDSEDPPLRCPYGLCVDKSGNILVADWGTHCVHILSKYGQHLGCINLTDQGLAEPTTVALSSRGYLFICCAPKDQHCKIVIYHYEIA